MRRAYRPSWDPCEEFRNRSRASESDFREISESLENEVRDITPPTVKTLAKALTKELPAVKAIWKSFLPSLSTEDVRRYRVPHYEVAILELAEAGYKDAAQYMRMLFDLDEEMRIKAGPGTIIWTNPRLKERVDFVDRLKFGLAEVNRAILGERQVAQAASLLEMALYFQKTTWEWWWVAERLFRSALTVSEDVEDDYQTTTIVKYLYGRFLFTDMKDTEGSLKFLNEAREASQEKSWNATKILGVKQDSLFRECCTLLYRIQLSVAKRAREADPDLAVEACLEAFKRALDSDHDEYITDATCELGRSYMRTNQPKVALQSFVKYRNLARKILDYDGICNAHMEQAFAYKELGDAVKAMEQLELFRETASRFQLPYKLAQAHYHIGEHLLNRNQLAQATSHLEFSFTLYNEMGKTEEAHQARCIAAVSKGQEFIDQFIDQIIECGKYDETATLKLCDWKNDRVPFWGQRTNEEDSYENEDTSKSENHPFSEYESSTQTEIVEVKSLVSTTSAISADLAPEIITEVND